MHRRVGSIKLYGNILSNIHLNCANKYIVMKL